MRDDERASARPRGQAWGNESQRAVMHAVAEDVATRTHHKVVAVEALRSDGYLEFVAIAGDDRARAKMLGQASPLELDHILSLGQEMDGWRHIPSERLDDETRAWLDEYGHKPDVPASGLPNGWDPDDQLVRLLENEDGELRPAATRYMLLKSSNLGIFPTLGAGYRLLDALRVGLAVEWGVFAINNFTMAPAGGGTSPHNDVRAHTKAQDWLVPAFTASVHVVPVDAIDFVVAFRWQDRIDSGLGYHPERSESLGSWNVTGLTDEADLDAPAVAGSEARRCRIPLAAGKGFLRLRVE